MNSVAKDICNLLNGVSSLGLTLATDLFYAIEPTDPSNCVTLFETPGEGSDLTMDITTYYRDSFQVRVRNVDYDTGYNLAKDIEEYLNGINHTIINGTTYNIIECSTSPVLLDFDDNNRPRFIINFNVQRKEV